MNFKILLTLPLLLLVQVQLSSQDLQDSFLHPSLNELMALYDMPKESKDHYLESKGYEDQNHKKTPTRLYEKKVDHDDDNFSIQVVSYFHNQLILTSFSTNQDAKVLIKQLEKDLAKSLKQELSLGKEYKIQHNGNDISIVLVAIDHKIVVTVEGPEIKEGSESAFLDACCTCMQKNLEGDQGSAKSQECMMGLVEKFPVQFSQSTSNDQDMLANLMKHCPDTMKQIQEKMGK